MYTNNNNLKSLEQTSHNDQLLNDLPEEKPQIVINKLMKLHSTGEFDENIVKEQIEIILVAGSDTTSVTLSFALLMVAMHPEIQERLFQELQSVFSSQNEEILNEHLSQLPYLELVLKETMRLFPAAPFPLRTTTTDIPVSNCTLPKGTFVMLSVLSMHRVSIFRDIFSSLLI